MLKASKLSEFHFNLFTWGYPLHEGNSPQILAEIERKQYERTYICTCNIVLPSNSSLNDHKNRACEIFDAER